MESFLQQKIRHYLETTGLSVAALERKAELKLNVARNILRGQSKRPGADTLQAIANVMECTVQDLLGVKNEALKADVSPPLAHPEILQDVLAGVLKVMQENNETLTLRQTLDVLAEAYSYAIKKDPPQIDMDFIEWFIKRTVT